MPVQNEELHGSAPDQSKMVLLLVDVINDLEFEGGETLLEHALPMAERVAELKKCTTRMGIPSVYVNDNFGKWQSDFRKLVSHCLHDDVRGRPMATLLQPGDEDYFVLKPKHSGFFSTTLDTLLKHLGARTLIVTGLSGTTCVFFTAGDAYMREYTLLVPSDCVASMDPDQNRFALELIRTTMKADIRPSTSLPFFREEKCGT